MGRKALACFARNDDARIRRYRGINTSRQGWVSAEPEGRALRERRCFFPLLPRYPRTCALASMLFFPPATFQNERSAQ
jgi:hypothetical protein